VAWNSLNNTNVEELKALGKELNGASINDILVSALTRSLGQYGRQQNSLAPDVLRGACWVALAPLKHVYTDFSEVPLVWGNKSLGACYLRFPIASNKTGMESLEEVKSQTADPSLPVEAMVGSKLLKLIGWLPRWIGRAVWNIASNNVSLSMSNLPGPQFPMQWCGAPISRMFFFVPATGTVSLFVTIATFDGDIAVGLGGDGAIFNQEALEEISGKLFQAEIQEMKAAIGKMDNLV
jgi:hypothetical protein